jgi:hypothetical protein
MAKKNNNSPYSVWLLFAISALLLIAGWLMKSFPLLIFVAYAPLFGISDQAKDKESPWNYLELILLALSISLLSASVFNFSKIILILAQAIIITLAFAGYSFAYQSLGSRIGKFTIIFFWLGLEYLLLKLPWREQFFYLADALQIQPTWWRWNLETGYLANTLWVLVVNLLFYLAVFRTKQVNWYLLALTVLLIIIPISYSHFGMEGNGITRETMIALYGDTSINENNEYSNRGELIARTAVWVSVLIILLALVKNKINKK